MSKLRSDNSSVLEAFRKSPFKEKVVLVLSTWFGIGLLPLAPGTFGTIATVPLILGLNILGICYTIFSLVIISAIAVWTSGSSQILLARKDPSEVVIDEVAGFLITMFLLPPTWPIIAIGFVLFRFFDIMKPYPIKKIEALRGGFGIVFDDLLAGIYANAGVRIIFFLLG